MDDQELMRVLAAAHAARQQAQAKADALRAARLAGEAGTGQARAGQAAPLALLPPPPPVPRTVAQPLLPLPLPLPDPRFRDPRDPPKPPPPLEPYGQMAGAAIAGRLARPVPAPRGPVFNPDIPLDPSQVEDRRRWYVPPYPGLRPAEPPLYQPWRWPEYRQRLAAWEQAYQDWGRGPRPRR
jgi:hypothetical protein